MKAHWEVYDDTCARLYDEFGERLASISKKGENFWEMDATPYFIRGYYSIGGRTLKEAMWKATLGLDGKCNQVIMHASNFRDGLPELHKLYEDAVKGGGVTNGL